MAPDLKTKPRTDRQGSDKVEVDQPSSVKARQCKFSWKDMSRIVTKPTKWHVRPAKTQISLGIRPIWSESSLSAWRKLWSLATH